VPRPLWTVFVLFAATPIALSAQIFTTLHSFGSQIGDGSGPLAALVQGTDGNFYGTTAWGGLYNDYGTVFNITPVGTLTTLYTFCSQIGCTDGANPRRGAGPGHQW